MNPEIKARWVEALRSGEFQQGHQALHRAADKVGPERFCCLGVLCTLAVRADVLPPPQLVEENELYQYGDGSQWEKAFLPQKVVDWAGLNSYSPYVGAGYDQALSVLNDQGTAFAEIADLIEEWL